MPKTKRTQGGEPRLLGYVNEMHKIGSDRPWTLLPDRFALQSAAAEHAEMLRERYPKFEFVTRALVRPATDAIEQTGELFTESEMGAPP